jgi:hypothetical protein
VIIGKQRVMMHNVESQCLNQGLTVHSKEHQHISFSWL